MIIYRDNVQLIIDEAELEKYQKEGFKVLEGEVSKEENGIKSKPISKMKVDELKLLATELGIEGIDSLNRDELIAVIKKEQNG